MDNYIVKNSLIQSLTEFIPRTSIPFVDVMVYTLLTGVIFRLFSYVTTIENWKEFIPTSKNPINWFFSQNVITITHMIDLEDRDDCDDDDNEKNLNNLLVIRAVRMLAKGGKSFKLRNVSEKDDYTNEYESELNKKIQLQLDDTVYDEGIEIDYWETTKKHKRSVGKDTMEVEKRDLLTLQLTSRSKSVEEITDYIQRKRDEYIRLMCAHQSYKKVWYPDEYKETKIKFQPYKFVGTKNWDSYFIPEKANVKKIVDNFEKKSGIYSIPGAQHKLGMLLHGIPGSGKSSLIKVIANYLDRHIIIVDVGKVLSGESLMKLFHDSFIYNGDENVWEYLPLNKRIIVFEEIDTAGSIVMDREKLEKTKEQDEAKFKKMFGNYKFYDVMYGGGINDASRKWKPLSSQNVTEGEGGGVDESVEESTPSVTSQGDKSSESVKDYTWNVLKRNEKCTLGDLLNLFDGLLELDGLVYIMTTNHREFLDKALTRPGRITLDIEFKNMKEKEVKELLTFYYIKYEAHSEVREAHSMEVREAHLTCPSTSPTSDDKLNIEKTRLLIDEIARIVDGKYKASKLEVMCQNYDLMSFLEIIRGENK